MNWTAHDLQGLVYQVYGLAFFLLGAVALVLPRRDATLPFARDLWLLAAFGLAHGTHEFVEWARIATTAQYLDSPATLLAALSFLPLLEFGRRVSVRARIGVRILSWLLYPVVAAGLASFALMAASPLAGFSAGARLFLGLPGALLTGLALVALLRRTRQDAATGTGLARGLAWLAAAFVGYGLVTPFVAPDIAGMPVWLPTTHDFITATGLPVQLPRAACAVAAALALIALVREAGERRNADVERILGTLRGVVYRCANDAPRSMHYLAGNMEELTGYPCTAFFGPNPVMLTNLIHPDDIVRIREEIRAALAARRDFDLSYRLRSSTGGERWMVERGRGAFAPNGALRYLEGHISDATERVELNARLGKIGSNAPGMIFQFLLRPDGSMAFPYASEGIRGIYGVTPEAVAQDATIVFERKHPDDLPALMQSIERSARDLTDWHHQYRATHPVKGEIWIEGRASPERLPDGGTLWHGALFDISAQKRAEIALERSLEELRASAARQRELAVLAQREQGRMAALLSGMSIGILFEDREQRIEYVNPAFRHMWAIAEDVELVGRPSPEVLEHSTHRLARPDHASKHILHVLDTHEISERFEVDLYDGRVLTQLSYPVSDTEGRAIGRLWLYEDITHERQTAQQLIYLAEHDALTGLYNRHRFQDHLERTISVSLRSGARFGLLYFDLDEFKTINDTFGHRAGDTVLVRAAGEVASLVRGGELFARLGGDEFAVLVEIVHGDEPIQLAERIVHAISAIPFRFRGSNLRLTASIGIALFPEHGDNAEDLVAHADTAMYQAKGAGKNTWAVYDARRNVAEAMFERMTWSSRIAHALEHDGLELHFQGIYRTRDGSLSHYEALVRMREPGQPERLTMPGQFIHIAEKNGQILDIDRWVIRNCIATLAGRPELAALAVNVSGRSFDEPGLPHFIQHQLAHFGVAPKRLIIELTETAAVAEMQDAQRFIDALRQTGCLICLDDFGSGFSTFAYLKYLGAHILKIDGMFVRDLPNNRENQAFVKAMIDVARGLDKITVAEFVEDAATLDMLRGFGVDMAQGYYLHRPSAQLPAL